MPVEGWLILEPIKYYQEVADLPADVAAELGTAMQSAVALANRRPDAVARVYLCTFGEDVRYHLHWHVVPRAVDSPESNWGAQLLLSGNPPAAPTTLIEEMA